MCWFDKKVSKFILLAWFGIFFLFSITFLVVFWVFSGKNVFIVNPVAIGLFRGFGLGIGIYSILIGI